MGHQPLRSESNCLNCGNEVQGAYCSQCGQKNVEVKLTFWQLITHFVSDLFHYDGKFFQSIKYLITKPGYLSTKWREGKRVSYLDPFKFYIFGSAIFFFAFSLTNKPSQDGLNVNFNNTTDISAHDSVNINGILYQDYQDYLNYQQKLAPEKQHGWGKRKIFERIFRFRDIIKVKGSTAGEYFIQLYQKSLPYMLFVCLPIIAGVLKLLYIKRKDYYYSDHGIFTMHLVLFFFIITIIIQLLLLADFYGSGFIIFLLYLFLIYGIYKAFKNFYNQSTGVTILKNFLFYVLLFFVILIVFVGGVAVLFFSI